MFWDAGEPAALLQLAVEASGLCAWETETQRDRNTINPGMSEMETADKAARFCEDASLPEEGSCPQSNGEAGNADR